MDLFSVIVVTVLIAGCLFGKYSENKAWNKGICPECEKGFFKSFDMASDMSVGYKCTNCGNTTWQSWNRRLSPAKATGKT